MWTIACFYFLLWWRRWHSWSCSPLRRWGKRFTFISTLRRVYRTFAFVWAHFFFLIRFHPVCLLHYLSPLSIRTHSIRRQYICCWFVCILLSTTWICPFVAVIAIEWFSLNLVHSFICQCIVIFKIWIISLHFYGFTWIFIIITTKSLKRIMFLSLISLTEHKNLKIEWLGTWVKTKLNVCDVISLKLQWIYCFWIWVEFVTICHFINWIDSKNQ